MPVPGHVKIVVSGVQPGGEVFAFGYSTLGAAANQGTLDAAVASASAVLTTSGAPASAFKSLITAQGSYTRVTGYSYEPGATGASLVSVGTIAVPGTGSGSLPFQVSLVATLQTAVPSRRTRGRLYLPATGVAIGTTAGLLTTPTPQAVADAVKALITASGELITPVVISRVGSIATAVTAVRVDNRLDVQRRRANKQLPTVTGTATI